MSTALGQLDKLIADMSVGQVRATGATTAQPARAQGAKGAKAAPGSKEKASSNAPAAAPAAPPPPPDPEFEARLALVRGVGEECVSDAELRNLLLKKPSFVLYDGFEPSGRMHIAQGTFKAMNVNKCTSAGGTFIFWVADWFALMNDKMGGDLERIRTVGRYLIHVWTAAGMDMTRVRFLWSSDEITKHAPTYWTQALDITRRFTVTRIKKCGQIMGRLEDTLTAAQILYPIMQCTDIFFLKADICQLGVDQRKVNMLAREYCDAAGIKLKPIILSHHMLYGLSKGQQKMSKSNKDSAIFMEDSADDVERKLRKAYCPVKEEASELKADEESMHLREDKLKNPCLDYVEHVIFSTPDATFTAGGKTYAAYAPVRDDFLGGTLSEESLKDGLVGAVNALLEPVRSHFETDAEAKGILSLIQEWMAEPKVARAPPLRRGAASISADLPAWAVFAPPPSVSPTLGALVDTLDCIRAAPDGSARVLYLADWSAYCANAISGGKAAKDDLGAIRASHDLFVGALTAIAPAMMEGVTVLRQSEVILANPNDYWISVIHAGRAFPLSKLRAVWRKLEKCNPALEPLLQQTLADVGDGADGAAVGAAMQRVIDEACHDGFGGRRGKDADLERVLQKALASIGEAKSADEAHLAMRRGFDSALDLGFMAGHVVTYLMHVADVLALAPAAAAGGAVCCRADQSPLHELASGYVASMLEGHAGAGLAAPRVHALPARSVRLKEAADETDAELLMLDTSADVQRKIKRAFCEPANVAFCPPLVLAQALVLPFADDRRLVIRRKPDDGGDLVFTDGAAVEAAYASGDLHPGDFKPAVRDAIDAILKRARTALAKDKRLAEAEKELAKAAKRVAAKAKGKK